MGCFYSCTCYCFSCHSTVWAYEEVCILNVGNKLRQRTKKLEIHAYSGLWIMWWHVFHIVSPCPLECLQLPLCIHNSPFETFQIPKVKSLNEYTVIDSYYTWCLHLFHVPVLYFDTWYISCFHRIQTIPPIPGPLFGGFCWLSHLYSSWVWLPDARFLKASLWRAYELGFWGTSIRVFYGLSQKQAEKIPRKQTYPLKIDAWKMKRPFNMVLFQGICSFRVVKLVGPASSCSWKIQEIWPLWCSPT